MLPDKHSHISVIAGFLLLFDDGGAVTRWEAGGL